MIRGRTNARYRSGNAIVIGDFVRPDETSAVLRDCEEIAARIGEVDCVTIHSRSSRNITTSCEHPFLFQAIDVDRTNCMLCRLAPGVIQVLSGYRPLAKSGHIGLALRS